jgi:hypothetical protein
LFAEFVLEIYINDFITFDALAIFDDLNCRAYFLICSGDCVSSDSQHLALIFRRLLRLWCLSIFVGVSFSLWRAIFVIMRSLFDFLAIYLYRPHFRAATFLLSFGDLFSRTLYKVAAYSLFLSATYLVEPILGDLFSRTHLRVAAYSLFLSATYLVKPILGWPPILYFFRRLI